MPSSAALTRGREVRPRFVGSEIYRRSTYGGKHPLAIPRVSTVTDLCRALALVRRQPGG